MSGKSKDSSLIQQVSGHFFLPDVTYEERHPPRFILEDNF